MAQKFLKELTTKRLSNTPLSTSFRLPSNLFGVGLQPNDERLFTKLKEKFTSLVGLSNTREETQYLLGISDCVDLTLNLPRDQVNSLAILTEFIDYLRAKILSDDVRKVRAAVLVVDTLLKNASYYKVNAHYVYYLCGSERFLKTISRQARHILTTPMPAEARSVGKLMLDCLQAWGEAFDTPDNRHVYSFTKEFQNLRDKHHMVFPRVPFDPERVPILLADLSNNKGRQRSGSEGEGKGDGEERAKPPYPPAHTVTDETPGTGPSLPALGTDTAVVAEGSLLELDLPLGEEPADYTSTVTLAGTHPQQPSPQLMTFTREERKESFHATVTNELPSWYTEADPSQPNQLVLYPESALSAPLPGAAVAAALPYPQRYSEQQLRHYQNQQQQQQQQLHQQQQLQHQPWAYTSGMPAGY